MHTSYQGHVVLVNLTTDDQSISEWYLETTCLIRPDWSSCLAVEKSAHACITHSHSAPVYKLITN